MAKVNDKRIKLATQREYVSPHGTLCPVCGSEDTCSGGRLREDDHYGVMQRMTCNTCESVWRDCYRLLRYDIIIIAGVIPEDQDRPRGKQEFTDMGIGWVTDGNN